MKKSLLSLFKFYFILALNKIKRKTSEKNTQYDIFAGFFGRSPKKVNMLNFICS